MSKFKNLVWVIALVAVIAAIIFLGVRFYQSKTIEVLNPIVTMEVEGYGTMTFELYPDQAPETVENFIALINNGYYDGTTFNRVVADFMIQGGEHNGDGTGYATINDLTGEEYEDEYAITGEFIANGVNNTIKFEEGTLAMARNDYTSMSSELISESYDSANCQFFIMTEENQSLNGYYASFGKIIDGLDVLTALEAVEVTASEDDIDEETGEVSEDAEISTPVTDIIITKITVDTKGVIYEYPTLLEAFDYMTWLYAQYGLSY